MTKKMSSYRKVALFCVEGDTEVEFYHKLLSKYLCGVPKAIINLEGIYNIHRKILGKVEDFLHKHSDAKVKVYCCIDRESRDYNPPVNVSILRTQFSEKGIFNGRVISVERIVATQTIESWYFYDIEGIYKFLRTPKSERNIKKYSPPEKFNHLDLASLFKRYGKVYIKGKKSSNFIDNLDIEKIYKLSTEVQRGLSLVTTKDKLPKLNTER